MNAFAGLHRREVRIDLVQRRFLAIHLQPAGNGNDFTNTLERFALDPGDPGGGQKFGGGIKDGEKTLRDQIIEFAFRFGQGLGRLRRGNNGEVIGDFRVVENPLVRAHPALLQNFSGERRVGRAVEHL
ncbi:MAG: hypothetical protein BWX84_01718 [Verrucomicrobia bacterium ADurb.Bin118]|nr:MAG: hypothetical protein BWX84_01718 [Verrucomicrobia bacterium ADurb.Bin118]